MNTERIAQLEKEMDVLSTKMTDIENECAKKNMPWNEYLKTVEPHTKAYFKALNEYRMIVTPEMESIPDYGDHMTMEDFVDCCKSGGFIDCDGSGVYATATEMSDIGIQPSEIMSGNYRKDFTHVVWFNK
jgi:hypothetical protein